MEQKLIKLDRVQLKMEGDGGFVGYASQFGGVDSYGDTIQKGAFASVIESGVMPKMFFNHNSFQVPIGVWKGMEEDDDGLKVVGEFIDGVALAGDVKAAMKAGALDGLSIGFRMTEDDFEKTVHGRLIKNVREMPEISVVTFPADGDARVDLDSVKSSIDGIHSTRDFEKFLRESGNFSKGLAQALTSKFKSVALSESKGDEDLKAALKETLNRLKR